MLLLFFVTEAIGKMGVYYHFEFEAQRYVKAIVIVLLSIPLLFYFRKSKIWFLLVMIIVYVLGQIFIDYSFSENSLLIFSRYCFPIVLFLHFGLFQKENKKILFKIFEAILVLNSVLIILGAIFSIYSFGSYVGPRFGYSGLIESSAAATYIYLIGLLYFLIGERSSFYKNWKFYFVLAAALLLGTKALYLGIFILGLELVFRLPKKYKFILLAVLLAVAFIGVYLIIFTAENFLRIIDDYGIFTALLSGRDVLWTEKTLPYINENWGFINYLFGSTHNFNLRAQMALFDSYFFFGIIGSLLYFYFYGKSFFTFKFKKRYYFYFIGLGVLVLFAGNFFTYAAIPIYFVILREKILETT